MEERHARRAQEFRRFCGALGLVSLPLLLLTAINVAPNRDEFIGVMGLMITSLFAIRDAGRNS